MQRIISLLLAIVIAISNLIPCGDADAAPLQGNAASAITVADACHDHGKHLPGDACSPFCSCSCCAAVALPVTLQLAFPGSEPFYIAVHTLAGAQSLDGTSVPVWQPPRRC